MGEIVIHNKSTTTTSGEVISAEERAEYLIKNNYPVPTTDMDELVALIQAKMKADEEAAKAAAAKPNV